MKIKSSARLIVELSLCMLSILTSLSTIQCASTAGRYTTVTETFSCQNATIKWKYLINNQDTLSQFIADVEANSTAIFTESLCIELKLSAMPATDRGVVYKLDILKLLNINLGNNGSLIFMGVPNHTHVSVDCITDNYTNLEDLNTTLKPFSKAALIVLSGLVFTRCPIPIVIEETDMVVIQNCIFVDHEHGAVNIFNSPKVIVTSCIFKNNTSTSYFTRKQFQGNGGGLSIGYNERLARVNYVDVLITNCEFINNSAVPPTNLSLSTTGTLQREIFSGRGGALGIPIKTSATVNVVISNSMFVDNFATNYGGALYQFVNEFIGNQTYTFEHNEFINNRALRGAGAVNFGNFGNNIKHTSFNGIFYNCTFENNSATLAGGLHIFPSYFGLPNNFIKMEMCKFYGNRASRYAGAVDIISYNYFGSRQHYEPFEFVNCEFVNNFGDRGGALAVLHFAAYFENVTFSKHRGPVILAVSGTLNFHGNITFVENDANGYDGGALFLRSFSQMTLDAGTHFEFVNNSGGLGASIVVENLNILPAFINSFFNPLCFVRYSDPTVPPDQWEQVSMTFIGNEAIVGSAVYANTLGLCSWYSYSPPYFNLSNVLRWPFVTHGNGNINSGQSKAKQKSFAVQTPAVDFSILNDTVSSYPGEKFPLTLLSYDEQNISTSATFRISSNINGQQQSTMRTDSIFEFDPSARTVHPVESTFLVQYNFKVLGEITSNIMKINHSIAVSSLQAHSSLVNHRVNYFNLMISPCPPGHILYANESTGEQLCKCNDDNDDHIVRCLPEQNSVVLEEGLWAIHVDDDNINSLLEYYHCPPGFCQCSKIEGSSEICSSVYSYDDENLQCVCDRQGYLCGNCRDGKGVSALFNKCVSCGNENVMLIIALVVVDIIIISLILLCSLALPAWLYPFLFYLQITPYIAQYFPATFSAVQPYLHYVSSATSLYFPYDFCLYSEMTTLVSYSLRYTPFLLAIIISSILYTANRKFKLARNLRLSWSGLWLLMVLLSTDVVNTSVSILNCPILQDSNGKTSLRWYYNGTVECFAGAHAAIAVIAILILMFYMIMVLLVTAIVMKKIKPFQGDWVVSINEKITKGFSDQCKWWPPVELMRRIIFIIFLNIVPGNLGPVLLLSMSVVMIYAYSQPYHSTPINLFEFLTIVDILLMLMISTNSQFKGSAFSDVSSLNQTYIDECGDVNRLSKQVYILTPLYYLPLVILCVIILVKVAMKLLGKWIIKLCIRLRKGTITDNHNLIDRTPITTANCTYYIELNDDDGVTLHAKTSNHTTDWL